MDNARFTISISSRDSELIEFIKEKRKNGSLSAYIRGLIRQELEYGQAYDIEQIYQYVEKRLRENGLALKENKQNDVKEIYDEIDKDVILNLF